jgi:hypothetical protein
MNPKKKNPTAVQDEFWIVFINFWAIGIFAFFYTNIA